MAGTECEIKPFKGSYISPSLLRQVWHIGSQKGGDITPYYVMPRVSKALLKPCCKKLHTYVGGGLERRCRNHLFLCSPSSLGGCPNPFYGCASLLSPILTKPFLSVFSLLELCCISNIKHCTCTYSFCLCEKRISLEGKDPGKNSF